MGTDQPGRQSVRHIRTAPGNGALAVWDAPTRRLPFDPIPTEGVIGNLTISSDSKWLG